MTMNKALLSDLKRHPLEDTLTAAVKGWLECQFDVAFYKASDRYNKGVSDFVVCVQGIMVCVELKADDGVISAHQKAFIKQFSEASAVAGVCYTLAEVKALVNEARRRAACMIKSV